MLRRRSIPIEDLTREELVQKADQAWEMAGLARQDGDYRDEQQWIQLAKALDAELKRRHQKTT